MLNSLASVMESSNVCLLAAIPSRSPRNAGSMSRPNRTGGHMPDPQKFNLAEWLVLLPIILGLVVAGAVIIR
jgi:hypothetical protein